eukprot:c21485_g2_i1.p1 GENE.c21485_g2_i1~~c21485_g2_i1.p1  ORF type:complete len:443 (+),score=141.42 c21485_g2_i1:135-1463(+)
MTILSLSPEKTVQTGVCHIVGGGRNGKGGKIKCSIRTTPKGVKNEDKKYIGIDGKWYDITTLANNHPGGNIILEYINKDATQVFHSFHNPNILNHFRIVGTYDPQLSPIDQDLLSLLKSFWLEGLFEPNFNWILSKIAFCMSLILIVFTCVIFGVQIESNFLKFLIGPIFLSLFWQQSGFLMHDTLHNQIFKKRWKNELLGSFFGTVCFGVSSTWWKDEHNEHHVFTNTVVSNIGSSDPQMKEDIWAQDKKLFQFFPKPILKIIIKIQKYIFLPILIFIGRFAIIIDSYINSEIQIKQIIPILIHWIWTLYLLSYFPTKSQSFLFYWIASIFQGGLELQLLLSHYTQPWEEKEASKLKSFYQRQIFVTKDISCPVWMDWLHGGLNFHIVHHLFPLLPRHNLRKATEKLYQICEKHKLQYKRENWSYAVWDTLRHLGEMQKSL